MATIRDQLRRIHVEDGVDHLNVSPFSVNETGKIAFPEWKKKFYIPHLGEFLSPRHFANWCESGGDDNHRYTSEFFGNRVKNIHEFRTLMMYAKYWQMSSVRDTLTANSEMLDLPWTMYKRYLTGVKEYNRWEDYPGIVKTMVEHIVNEFDFHPFNFEEVLPGVTSILNRHIRVIAGPEFVGIENIDELVESRKREEQMVNAKKPKKHHQEKAPSVDVSSMAEVDQETAHDENAEQQISGSVEESAIQQ